MRNELKTPVYVVETIEEPPRLRRPVFYPADRQGKFVAVRKAGPGERTKLGIYLGDLDIQVGGDLHDDGTLAIKRATRSPAIYVPEDMQLVYGAESWWRLIEGPDQLREITDGDIEDVWYVQALKQLEREAAERATEGSDHGDLPAPAAAAPMSRSELGEALFDAILDGFWERSYCDDDFHPQAAVEALLRDFVIVPRPEVAPGDWSRLEDAVEEMEAGSVVWFLVPGMAAPELRKLTDGIDLRAPELEWAWVAEAPPDAAASAPEPPPIRTKPRRAAPRNPLHDFFPSEDR